MRRNRSSLSRMASSARRRSVMSRTILEAAMTSPSGLRIGETVSEMLMRRPPFRHAHRLEVLEPPASAEASEKPAPLLVEPVVRDDYCDRPADGCSSEVWRRRGAHRPRRSTT